MSGKEIRAGQLLAPFGPGSIYIDSYGTPLIVGGLDHWMQEYVDGVWENCEEQNEFLGIIHSTSRNMLAMINDLLDISRIESGNMQLSQKNGSLNKLIIERIQIIQLLW